MGNVLVGYLRLRNEFALVPNAAAVESREGILVDKSRPYVAATATPTQTKASAATAPIVAERIAGNDNSGGSTASPNSFDVESHGSSDDDDDDGNRSGRHGPCVVTAAATTTAAATAAAAAVSPSPSRPSGAVSTTALAAAKATAASAAAAGSSSKELSLAHGGSAAAALTQPPLLPPAVEKSAGAACPPAAAAAGPYSRYYFTIPGHAASDDDDDNCGGGGRAGSGTSHGWLRRQRTATRSSPPSAAEEADGSSQLVQLLLLSAATTTGTMNAAGGGVGVGGVGAAAQSTAESWGRLFRNDPETRYANAMKRREDHFKQHQQQHHSGAGDTLRVETLRRHEQQHQQGPQQQHRCGRGRAEQRVHLRLPLEESSSSNSDGDGDSSPTAAAAALPVGKEEGVAPNGRQGNAPSSGPSSPFSSPSPSPSSSSASAAPSLSSPLSDIGPLDCADAFLYFREDLPHPNRQQQQGGTRTHFDSAVFRAPAVAAVPLQQLEALYQSGIGAAGGLQAAAAERGPFVSLFDDLRERCIGTTNSNIGNGGGGGGRCRPVGSSAGEAATGKPQPQQYAIAWRCVDRVTHPAAAPAQIPTASTATAAPTLADNSFSTNLFPTASNTSHHQQKQQQEDEEAVYYMGPPQHLTYAALWSRVVAFGWGLRSLGLSPGSTVGLCSAEGEARWEWLVTLYACWARGIVPVVFPSGGGATLAVVAAECTDVRVVVCPRSCLGPIRSAVRAALAAARAVEDEGKQQQQQQQDAMGEEGRGRHKGKAPPPSAQQQQQQRRSRRRLPLFVAMRDPVGSSQQQSTPTSGHTQKQQQGKRPSNGNDNGNENDDDEALWWVDVLTHGERALAARERRRLRPSNATSRHQHNSSVTTGGGGGGRRADSALTAATATTSDGGATSTTAHTTGAGASNPTCGAYGCPAPAAAWALTGTTRVSASPRSHRLPQQQQQATVASSSLAAPASLAGPGPGNSSLATRTSAHDNHNYPQKLVSGIAGRSLLLHPTTAAATHRTASGSPHHQAQHRQQQQSAVVASSSLLSPPSPPLPSTVSLRPTDLAMVLYSEGEPKGALLTHGALKASATAYAERLRAMGILPPADKATTSTSTATPQPDASTLMGRPRAGHHDSLVSSWRRRRTSRPSQQRRTYLAHQPQHSAAEVVLECLALSEGLLLCFGSRGTLFDGAARPRGDLSEFKPVLLAGAPELFECVRRSVEATLPAGGYRRLLFDVGYEDRRLALRRGLDTPFLNRAVFSQPRQLLGGRCALALCTGGPLHPRTQEYLEVVTGAAAAQLFAPAEAGGCGLLQVGWAAERDSAGGPMGAVEVKLRDVPGAVGVGGCAGQGGCPRGAVTTTTANSNGGWCHHGVRPAGELLLRGPTVSCGYYRQPERAAAVLDRDGWLHTGQLAERLPDGGFRLLAQLPWAVAVAARNGSGRPIALEHLEAVYSQHPLCSNDTNSNGNGGGGGVAVCVLAHPYRSYLAALVLTDEPHARGFLSHWQTTAFLADWERRQRGQGGDDHSGGGGGQAARLLARWPHCLSSAAFSAAAAVSLAHHGAANTTTAAARGGLQPHEGLRTVRVLFDSWTAINGLRSATGRLQRAAIEARYAATVAELFSEVC